MRAVDEWWPHAACRGKPLNWWFPTPHGDTTWDKARAICATCPVATQCADYADHYGCTHGMYGGLDPNERAETDPRCGTEAGFAAHRVAGTEPCDGCRTARHAGQKRRRDARRRTQLVEATR